MRYLLMIMLACIALLARAGMHPSWVWPMHKTTKPLEKTFTLVERYQYSEQLFDPAFTITLLPVGERNMKTPEDAFASRISAMMDGDFKAWMASWSPDARIRVEQHNLQQGHGEQYWLQWWKDTFRFANYQLVRKIRTGKYVILTYRQIGSDGQDVGRGIEFPAIMENISGKWYSTQALATDPLLPASPWVSGEDKVEITVR